MKTWIHVEKAFKDAGIKYQQKTWIFLCEIESRQFYYSPQSGKWRVKRSTAWQTSNSVEEFIKFAAEYPRTEKGPKRSRKSRQAANQKRKKARKTKASSSQSRKQYREHQQKTQNLKDEVRPEFLELFGEKVRTCNERSYKPAWIWKTLLDKYLLTAKEVCWLCTVFDYAPGWAYHQAKDQHPELTYEEVLASIAENRQDWLKYFNSRWHFASKTESKEEESRKQESRRERSRKERSRKNRYRQQDYQRQKDYRSTQPGNSGGQYQNYLHLLQLNFPFSRQELKTAYRKKARSTHPDTGGTTEAFRKVHTAFEILSALAN